MDGKDLFLLWWLFVDVVHTRNLRVLISHPSYRKFNHELVGFLANNEVKSVAKCTFRYNWILKADYITAFGTNMPNLRHVIFYSDPPTDDLLKILAENCQKLWKLEFIGKINTELQENSEINNVRRFSFFSSRAKGKLSSQGYRNFFEKQNSLREIDLSQIEKDLDKEVWSSVNGLDCIGYNPLVKESCKILTSVLDPLKDMKQLTKLIVTHNYIEMIDSLPQIEQVELRLTRGLHPLEETDVLRNQSIWQKTITSSEHGSVYSTSCVPIDNLVPSDMNKLEKLCLQRKFPGMKKLTLEFRIFAAAKGSTEVEDEEDNPNFLSLGILNTDYASPSIKTILQDLPLSLHIRFGLFPRLLKWKGNLFLHNIPLFRSFDAFFMESLATFNKAETIVMTDGATETAYQFRVAWININNSNGNGVLPVENQENCWGGWSFGLQTYMKENGLNVEGHVFTKVAFPNLTFLELNFGDPGPYIHSGMGGRTPPVSHDLFCQLFFLSDCLRKIKLTIPGGIAKFDEKDFIGKCNTTYGRQKLSKLNRVSLWFSTSSIKRHSPDRLEPGSTILSVFGFLSLLMACSKESSLESMVWFNLTGDNEKRFLREHETEGTYLPCVTHLLNRFVPMVAAYQNHEGTVGTGWLCSDLRRAAALTT